MKTQRTIIEAISPRGVVVFRAVEPRIMTQAEIHRELEKWAVRDVTVTVKYDTQR